MRVSEVFGKTPFNGRVHTVLAAVKDAFREAMSLYEGEDALAREKLAQSSMPSASTVPGPRSVAPPAVPRRSAASSVSGRASASASASAGGTRARAPTGQGRAVSGTSRRDRPSSKSLAHGSQPLQRNLQPGAAPAAEVLARLAEGRLESLAGLQDVTMEPGAGC